MSRKDIRQHVHEIGWAWNDSVPRGSRLWVLAKETAHDGEDFYMFGTAYDVRESFYGCNIERCGSASEVADTLRFYIVHDSLYESILHNADAINVWKTLLADLYADALANGRELVM